MSQGDNSPASLPSAASPVSASAAAAFEANSGDDLPPGVLRVDITPHKRQPGTQRPMTGTVVGLEGMELPSVEVSATAVTLDLQLEIVGEQLSVSGAVSAVWSGPCRRCLDPMHETALVDIQEIFEFEPTEGETYKREKDFADLRPMIIESVVLALPVAPLCSEDCVGPAPESFPTTAASESADDSSESPESGLGDPRWAALDALKFDE